MVAWVADYSLARPAPGTLRAAGCVGVIRYTGQFRSDGAVITKGEYDALVAAGLHVGLVLEYDAAWILRGYQAGHDLASAARQLEDSMGVPRGVTYGAADFDIQPYQYQQALATMHGMADAYGGWAYVGGYGSRPWCDWLATNTPVTHLWSTVEAWSAGIPSTHAQLAQHFYWPSNVPVVGGCDFNSIQGDWAPRTTSEDDLTPEQDNVLRTCAKAIMQLGGAITTLQQDLATIGRLLSQGDASHVGNAQILDAIKALPSVSGGGTVDPAPIVAAVMTELKAATIKVV